MSFKETLETLLDQNETLKAYNLGLENVALKGSAQSWDLGDAIDVHDGAGFKILAELYVAGPQSAEKFSAEYGVNATTYAVAKLYSVHAVEFENGKIVLCEKGKTVCEKIERLLKYPLKLYWAAENSASVQGDGRRSHRVLSQSAKDLYRIFGQCCVGLYVDRKGKFIFDSDQDMDALMHRVKQKHTNIFMSFKFARLTESSGLPYEE